MAEATTARSKSKIIILFPLSLLLLSLLRVGHFVNKHFDVSSFTSSLGTKGLGDKTIHQCSHEYSVELMSFDPLVLYVNSFIKDEEIDHLLDRTKKQFKDSSVYTDDGNRAVDKSMRSSKSATVPAEDAVSQCLAKRLESLLGNIRHDGGTELLHLVKYEVGGEFRMHRDYLTTPLSWPSPEDQAPSRLYNRVASMFVYLEDDCTGGETYFPDLKGVEESADGAKFSRTNRPGGMGLLVKPRRGSAIFWVSVHANGTGDDRLSHASLPVKSGTKIGMNMFGLYYLDMPVTGDAL